MEEKLMKINADYYTLKAQVNLRNVEENELLKKAIKEGNQEIFDEILRGILEIPVTWGDHIKRYIYDVTSDGSTSIEDMTDKQMKIFIEKSFEDNGMRNRASLNPKDYSKLSDPDKLEKWLKSPVTEITRNVCFLFAFGLNMDEEQTSYMLTYVLRQSDFNARDPQEAIYYYCLRNNMKYKGVVEWQQFYKELETEKIAYDMKTVYLNKNMRSAADNQEKAQFIEYLITLKRLPSSKKKSASHAEIFRELINRLGYCVSTQCNISTDQLEKKLDKLRYKKSYNNKVKDIRNTLRSLNREGYKNLEAALMEMSTEGMVISPICEQLIQKKMIHLPFLSKRAIENMVEQRTTIIHREDILAAIFLLETVEIEAAEAEGEEYSYQHRKANFVYEANLILEKCGFNEVYLLNPFELFLISCLLQEKPMTYFIAVWKKYRGE